MIPTHSTELFPTTLLGYRALPALVAVANSTYLEPVRIPGCRYSPLLLCCSLCIPVIEAEWSLHQLYELQVALMTLSTFIGLVVDNGLIALVQSGGRDGVGSEPKSSGHTRITTQLKCSELLNTSVCQRCCHKCTCLPFAYMSSLHTCAWYCGMVLCSPCAKVLLSCKSNGFVRWCVTLADTQQPPGSMHCTCGSLWPAVPASSVAGLVLVGLLQWSVASSWHVPQN